MTTEEEPKARDDRRDRRYTANITVALTRGQEVTRLMTDDVSFRGAFLRTDAPAPMRQLVRVAFTLPDHQVVAGHAMVVHVVPPSAVKTGGARVPGMGVQFWGDVKGADHWARFIQKLKAAPGRTASIPPPGTHDPIRRSSSRFRIKLEVRLPDRPEMIGLATRDISEDGMCVATDVNYPPGLKARLMLIHPATAEAFPVDVIVRRHVKEADFSGMGVEFMDKSPEAREQLLTFLRIPLDEAQEP
jgi:hypothetical protein